jgi:hypothetical protein
MELQVGVGSLTDVIVGELLLRVSKLEISAESAAQTLVAVAYSELAEEYRGMWKEERAKRLDLEFRNEKLAGNLQASTSVPMEGSKSVSHNSILSEQVETDHQVSSSRRSSWKFRAGLIFSHLLFASVCILVMRAGAY